MFQSVQEFVDQVNAAQAADKAAALAAQERNMQLTKPQAALGRLEELAIWYAAWRKDPKPDLKAPQIVIFAGNHGVAARGVSAFPAEVTAQMVGNFAAGGAAINQLAQCFGASLDVVPLALEMPTKDFTQTKAMDAEELLQALQAGWQAVNPEADLFITGEMGIANTTSASALAAALTDQDAEAWVGRGTGVEGEALALKKHVVAEGLARHAGLAPMETLAALGGREIAAMIGALGHARVLGIPVLLDGFICSAAALVLQKACPDALENVQAAHLSQEGAHGRLLQILGKEPLLALDLRLGEGSGAALAIGVLKAAIACHSGMATFAEAGVADGA